MNACSRRSGRRSSSASAWSAGSGSSPATTSRAEWPSWNSARRDINARYTRAQDLLTTVRGQVLMGSVYVRDALLDPNPGDRRRIPPPARRELSHRGRGAARATCRWSMCPASRAHRRGCGARSTISAGPCSRCWRTDSREWPAEARDLLRRRIMPKREGVMRISEEVQALNRSAFVQQQLDIASLYRATQRRVWQTVGLALAASVAIALAGDALRRPARAARSSASARATSRPRATCSGCRRS